MRATEVGGIAEGLSIRGHLTLTVMNADGSEADRREGDNVICTNGYSAFAAAMVWSGIQDQATSIGVTAPTYLTPLWGAVGTGAGVPAKSDTQLFTEYAREQVQAGASSPATSLIAAQATWLFFFAPPAITVGITEAGVFALADSGTNDGTLLDHWAFSPTVTVTNLQNLILQVSFAMGP